MKTNKLISLAKLFFMVILLANGSAFSQNLIKNPGFESGTIPTTAQPPEYLHTFDECVPFWRAGCDVEPVMGYTLTPDILTVGATNCYWSVPSNNRTTNLPVRVAGTTRYVYCGYSQTNNLKESILGTLTQPLVAGMYNVSFYGSKIKGISYCSGGSTFPLTDPGATIEVILHNSSDPCSASDPVVWTSSQITTLDSWQQSAGSFMINCDKAAKNYDRIEFRIKTATGVRGVFIDDVSLTKTVMNPAIISATNFCSGTPLTFTGTMTQATSISHLWEIQECNATGTLIGNPLYGLWVSGNPGTFTFPSTLNLPCNKYYRVKLAPSNDVSCEWVETTKIIRINCNPTINTIPNQTICNGSSASFTVASSNWPVSVYRGTTLVGNFSSNPIALSPATTTVYTFKTTNTAGCSTSQTATVTVNNCPKACFVINNVVSVQYEDSFYGPQPVNMICRPLVEIDGSCSEYEQGYYISIYEFTLSSWTSSTLFYNGWVTATGAVPSSIDLTALVANANANTGGISHVFDSTKLYSIGLAVGPVWNAATTQFFRVKTCTKPLPVTVASKTMDNPAVGATSIAVFPNPVKDVVNIVLAAPSKGTLAIYSIDGKMVYHKDLDNEKEITVDLTDNANGMYLVKINIGGELLTEKFIKN